MIPINDPKLMNAFHIEDLLREAEMYRLAQELKQEQVTISDQLLASTGNVLISAGNWFKAHSHKHSQN